MIVYSLYCLVISSHVISDNGVQFTMILPHTDNTIIQTSTPPVPHRQDTSLLLPYATSNISEPVLHQPLRLSNPINIPMANRSRNMSVPNIIEPYASWLDVSETDIDMDVPRQRSATISGAINGPSTQLSRSLPPSSLPPSSLPKHSEDISVLPTVGEEEAFPYTYPSEMTLNTTTYPVPQSYTEPVESPHKIRKISQPARFPHHESM